MRWSYLRESHSLVGEQMAGSLTLVSPRGIPHPPPLLVMKEGSLWTRFLVVDSKTTRKVPLALPLHCLESLLFIEMCFLFDSITKRGKKRTKKGKAVGENRDRKTKCPPLIPKMSLSD
ncbi:hypothetical protein Acr_00g0004570 [Actinidia rufa]|uniref:Uncharacterized protein n=1 Tax=Actinidia rufa TaxID=165716 RepID=A0A7J0D6A8_9ERIC|nr:hypothetical protein Acr_00g0000180 [Actinidia rufa]GFS28203.1 hypothetical protein Acr_00g0000490 [Actinidia rufa]GFS28903.1 hypothetical protein Acr_00g0004570 [Actinidia rufa]